MMTIGKSHLARLMMAVILLSLLSACALVPPSLRPDSNTNTSAQAANGDKPTIDRAKVIPARQEITPSSSIEKRKLSISYSLKTIHGKHEELVRLTLIFKNLADKSRHIWPHITLIDARGKTVKAYSLKTFLRISSRRETGRNTDSQHAGQTSDQWTDMYWIKRSYQIPPHGIAIGELIYHGKKLNFPMKLTVRIYKDYYRFTAKQ